MTFSFFIDMEAESKLQHSKIAQVLRRLSVLSSILERVVCVPVE
jgi:hypothetical protein